MAAFAHASWNLVAKRAAGAGPMFVCAYNLVSCILYGPWVLYQLGRGGAVCNRTVVAVLIVSGIIHLAYSLFLQRGYQVADLSVVYPVARGTAPMLSTIAALAILGESASPGRLLGLLLVIIGIGVIATRGDLSAFERPGAPAGIRWGGMTGALIASYSVVDAYAVKAVGVAPVVLDWFSNLLRFAALLPFAARRPKQAFESVRGYWPHAVAVGFLSPLGYILILAALASGAPLSRVAPIRETSMVIATLLGMLFLHERTSRWGLAGCGIVIGGVALLSSA